MYFNNNFISKKYEQSTISDDYSSSKLNVVKLRTASDIQNFTRDDAASPLRTGKNLAESGKIE